MSDLQSDRRRVTTPDANVIGGPAVPAPPSPQPPVAVLPGTRAELQAWVREHLALPPDEEGGLNAAIDAVVTRQERLWQQSKDDAIKAVMDGFAERMTVLRHALVERDET